MQLLLAYMTMYMCACDQGSSNADGLWRFVLHSATAALAESGYTMRCVCV